MSDSGEPRRWTIYVCPGCGSYAGEYGLAPRFGNIVVHERMTEGCAERAEAVEVVEVASGSPVGLSAEEAARCVVAHEQGCPKNTLLTPPKGFLNLCECGADAIADKLRRLASEGDAGSPGGDDG